MAHRKLSEFEELLLELVALQYVHQDLVFRAYIGWDEENSLTNNCLDIAIDLQQSTFTYHHDDTIQKRI